MKKTIRVGMIGAGQVAKGHCRGVQQHPQAKLTCVADLSQKRGKALAKEFGAEKTYARWEDLVSDPDVDAVAIALPNFLHAPVSLGSLKAGKHVILDKPFALNYAEAKKVVDTAKKMRKVFMVGMNQRFTADAQTLKVLAQRGDLGEIYHAKAYWWRRTGIPKFGTWFTQKKLSGGGGLLDVGVHMLDVCMHVMGNWKPVSVTGRTYTKFGNRGLGEGGWGMSDAGKHIFDVDDFATALITFQNGASLQLDVTWACHRPDRGGKNVELFGTEAGATLDPLQICRFGKKKGEYEVVTPQNVKIPHPAANRHVHWIDVILRKAKPFCKAEESLVIQKVLDGIYKSSKTGKEVRLR